MHSFISPNHNFKFDGKQKNIDKCLGGIKNKRLGYVFSNYRTLVQVSFEKEDVRYPDVCSGSRDQGGGSLFDRPGVAGAVLQTAS